MATQRTPLPNLQPILLGIGCALLVGSSVATVYLVDRSATDTQRLSQTLSVDDKLAYVLLSVRRAESSQRGYLFTDDPKYLAEFYEAEPEARQLVEELRTPTRDNPARQATLDEIARHLEAKFKEMGETVNRNQQGDAAGARQLVLSTSCRAITESLRKTIDEAILDEARLAAERTTQSQQTSKLLLYVTLAGAAFIVLIGAASIMLVQRTARQRETARAELEATNANLERIVEFRTADLTEANEEIQRFAYIVSHDLRSPLVNIMGFTSELAALRQDIFNEVARLNGELTAAKGAPAEPEDNGTVQQLGADFDEAIGFIKTSIGNMDRLINAVLKLSREGRRQFHPETVNMAALISSLVETVAHRAAELEATISVEDLPPVETDPLAAQQIFGNLIDIALKYRRIDEKLQIGIRGRLTATHAIYEVQDNGRGIDRADFQRVFELFRRAGKQDRPGEGIGLAHVRALVRRLGGTMGLTSELDKGSTFTVTLPRRWSVAYRSAARLVE